MAARSFNSCDVLTYFTRETNSDTDDSTRNGLNESFADDLSDDNAQETAKSPSPEKVTPNLPRNADIQLERSGFLWESSNTSSEDSSSEISSDISGLDIGYQQIERNDSDSSSDSDDALVNQAKNSRTGEGSILGKGNAFRGRGSSRGRGKCTSPRVGRGRGRRRGRGRDTRSGGSSSYLPIPHNAKSLDTEDSTFEGMEDFLTLRDVGPHVAENFNKDIAEELDFFHLYIDNMYVERLVNSTEDYAERNKERKPFMYKLFKMHKLTAEEMIAVLLLLSISSVRSYRQAWDKNSSQVSHMHVYHIYRCTYILVLKL